MANWPAGAAAFVTGAASGMGLGTARALVAAGAKVALADIDAARLEDVAAELRAAGGTVVAVPLDVTDADAWKASADAAEAELGPISILAQFAGVSGSMTSVETVPLRTWRWVMQINLEAIFLGVSTFLPRFKERGGRAHILNTSSMAGVVPFQHAAEYAASKFAVVGLSQVLREENRDSEIGVSVLCPGTVATRLSTSGEELQAKAEGREPNQEKIAGLGAALATGADPDAVGTQVVEAIQNNDFYIFTHKEWWPLVERVHEEQKAAFAALDGRHGVDQVPLGMLQGENPV